MVSYKSLSMIMTAEYDFNKKIKYLNDFNVLVKFTDKYVNERFKLSELISA